MATKKISELTAVATPAGTDALAVVQGGETKRETVAQALSVEQVAANITGGTINGAAIGGTTPAAGAFTTLTASSATTVAGLGLSNAVTNGGNVATIQKITQAAYDLLAPAVATTLYVIVD